MATEITAEEARRLARDHWSEIADARQRLVEEDEHRAPHPHPELVGQSSSVGWEVATSLDVLREMVFDLVYHDADYSPAMREEMEEYLDDIVRRALAERLRRQRSRDTANEVGVTFQHIISQSVKVLRERARATQKGLAERMDELGFGWKRNTVAEVESGKRALSLEEMLGIAILFDVPLAFLLSSLEIDEVLQVNESLRLTAAQAQELIGGEEFGVTWRGIRLAHTTSGGLVLDEDPDAAIVDGGRRLADLEFWSYAEETEQGMQVIRRFTS